MAKSEGFVFSKSPDFLKPSAETSSLAFTRVRPARACLAAATTVAASRLNPEAPHALSGFRVSGLGFRAVRRRDYTAQMGHQLSNLLQLILWLRGIV